MSLYQRLDAFFLLKKVVMRTERILERLRALGDARRRVRDLPSPIRLTESWSFSQLEKLANLCKN